MADALSVVAKINLAIAEAQAIGAPPPVGDLSWFLGRPARSITNVGAATLQALNPCPSNQCAYSGTTKFRAILAASGMTICSWRGTAGSIVVFGGGHDDYYGNEVAEFDLGTRQWSLLSQPWPNRYRVAGATDWTSYHGNTDEGELWADGDFASYATMAAKPTLQNQPIACHTFGQSLALPPDAAFPAGAVLMPNRPSCTPGGQRNGRRAHAFDLSTGTWARYSANLMPESPAYSNSFIDRTRNLAVCHSAAGLVGLPLSPSPTARMFGKLVALPSYQNYVVWAHLSAADVYAGVTWNSGAPAVWVVDAKTKAFTRPGLSGAWPAATQSGGGDWSALLGGFVYYHGSGATTAVLINPPAGDPRTMPWTVQTLAFTGDAPPVDDVVGAGAHCKRFLEYAAAGGFLWLGRAGAPVQFWRA